MLKQIRPAIVMLVLMTVLTGIAYPLAITGIAGAVFPHQAGGSLIVQNGKVIGSELIGQGFAADKYFHGRPSDRRQREEREDVPARYDASNSSGTNLGPTSKALIDGIKGDVAAAEKENPGTPVPVDLVTSSASGLDQDITPASALFQVPRVAKARQLSEASAARSGREAYREPRLRPDRRGPGQRAGAQPGAGQARRQIIPGARRLRRGITSRHERPRPECAPLARSAAQADGKEGRGRLKIFFGAAPGVGKTYEMLVQARGAQAAKAWTS